MWRAMALCAAAYACCARSCAPATTPVSVSAVVADSPADTCRGPTHAFAPLPMLRGAASAAQAHGACRVAARSSLLRVGMRGPARRHAHGRCRMAAEGGPVAERGEVALQRWARAVGIDHGKWGVGAAEGGTRGALAAVDIAEGEVPESAHALSCARRGCTARTASQRLALTPGVRCRCDRFSCPSLAPSASSRSRATCAPSHLPFCPLQCGSRSCEKSGT